MENYIDDFDIFIEKYVKSKIFGESVYFLEVEKYNILACPTCNGTGYISKIIDNIEWKAECPLCHNRQLGYNDNYKKGNRLVKTGYSTYRINKGIIRGINIKCENNDSNSTIMFLILPLDSKNPVWVSSEKCAECKEDIDELLEFKNALEFKIANNRLEGLSQNE